ncbi:MAG TPA: response regulator [Verrucomicrobiae bacterium]|nr:response regulator [Verrucomicrobiae bacterium]
MNSKKILLVEDDPLGVELALAAFEESALAGRVEVVNDGVEALEYLNRAGNFSGRTEGNPTVMLLDLKMPRMDGLQVLERVRAAAHLRTIPIVMLSSSREESDKRRSYELGANAYVVKPVDFDEFKSTVRRIGRFWAEINEPPPAGSRQN